MSVVAAGDRVGELARAYHLEGDEEARDELVAELLPLVRSLALRYSGRGEPLEDLVQVGAIGLIKAIDRFDLDRGVALTTYAVPTIVGEIRRHFRDKGWAMRVPRRIKELHLRLTSVIDDLSASLGRSPTIAELANATGATEEEVIEALESAAAYSTRSLSVPAGDDGSGDLLEIIGDEDDAYALVDDVAFLEDGLDALEPRDRRIVELRFFDELTQSQIAAEVGLSQMHVSRLLRRSLHLMRGRLEEQPNGPDE
jgi:RNA polymerase sigma-B factor